MSGSATAPQPRGGTLAAAPAADPSSLIRSRDYRVLLVVAAFVGLLVSAASWGFLELVHVVQIGVYTDLPRGLGYDVAPTWWSLPWLALAGLLTAFAIARLPGHGGHVPADGLKPAERRRNRSSCRASSSPPLRRSRSDSCSAPRHRSSHSG